MLLLSLFTSEHVSARARKGIVEIGDEKKEVTKNTLIESQKDIMHCWYNENRETLRFLVIKTQFPKEPTKFLD
jgi:hypothetical protein